MTLCHGVVCLWAGKQSQKGLNYSWSKVTSGLGINQRQRFWDAEGGAVGPGVGEGIEAVDHRKEAREQGKMASSRRPSGKPWPSQRTA